MFTTIRGPGVQPTHLMETKKYQPRYKVRWITVIRLSVKLRHKYGCLADIPTQQPSLGHFEYLFGISGNNTCKYIARSRLSTLNHSHQVVSFHRSYLWVTHHEIKNPQIASEQWAFFISDGRSQKSFPINSFLQSQKGRILENPFMSSCDLHRGRWYAISPTRLRGLPKRGI